MRYQISVVIPVKRRGCNFAELNSTAVYRRKYIAIALVNHLHKITGTFLVLEAKFIRTKTTWNSVEKIISSFQYRPRCPKL
jgi:hypothetical protein